MKSSAAGIAGTPEAGVFKRPDNRSNQSSGAVKCFTYFCMSHAQEGNVKNEEDNTDMNHRIDKWVKASFPDERR